jgi:hypothetical protein
MYFLSDIILLCAAKIKRLTLKLRGFIIRFSAARPCGAGNRRLLLRSTPLVNDMRESLLCLAAVD